MSKIKDLSPTPLSMTALEAAQRICTLYETAQALSQIIESQVMEALWVIKRHLPDEKEFDFFISSRTPLKPREARLMVQTWDAARKNRELRELAQNKPSEALRLVQGFLGAGLEDKIETLDDDDKVVASILSKPPRKRNAAIRELIEVKQSVKSGHHPADREQIKTLTAERDAAVAALEDSNVIDHPAAQIKTWFGALRKAESNLAALSKQAQELLPQADDLTRQRAARCADMAIESIEQIMGAAMPGEDRA